MCLAVFAVIRAADSNGHYGGDNSKMIPSFVSIAVIKYDDKNQLREERSLRSRSIAVGKSRQEFGPTGPITSAVKR